MYRADRKTHPSPFRFLTAFALALLIFVFTAPGQAHANPKYASIVVDAQTGRILSERYADKKLHPASLTKAMTLYITFDALKAHRLRRGQRIRISRHAASMVPSKLGLEPGETITVEDAILALVTKSANDVAAALGEAIAGSEDRFALLMTRRARQLGMKNTVFKNASGLHHRSQVSTARDMAILARALIYDHPEYYHYFSVKKFKYRGDTYSNHNKLMNTYDGMDGLKTGYVNAAGFNLMASAVQNNRRLIGVVFGGRTSRTRNAHMKVILDRGFAKINDILMAQNQPLPTRKPDFGAVTVASAEAGLPTNASGLEIDPEALVGEGDIDPEASRDLAASLRSMAKTDGGVRAVDGPNGGWAVQIGAFYNRDLTRNTLKSAASRLPREIIRNSVPIIAPLSTGKGVIYRARIGGLDKKTAEDACKILGNCIILASR